MDFLSDLERHITQSTDDHHESGFRFQRLSVLIEHYNAVERRAVQNQFLSDK